MRLFRSYILAKGAFYSWVFFALAVFAMVFPNTSHSQVSIPSQSDWTTEGIIIQAGDAGAWDARLHGMISPCGIVKKGDTYYLYYIGADGDRSTDGGPRYRALGVATSKDGLTYTKYEGNPIIKHLPNNNEEEGIFSATVTLDDADNVVLYYGSMNAGSSTSTSVDSDVSVAISSDGLNFTEYGDVLDSGDSQVWGYGDELFPIASLNHNGRWLIYYGAKGKEATWELGVASGVDPISLPDTAPALKSSVYVIGGGTATIIDDDTAVIFLVRDFGKGLVEARTFNPVAPAKLSEPVVTYDFGPDWRHTSIYLDRDNNRWLFFHRPTKGNEIWLRKASVSGSTTPNPPQELQTK